MTWTRFSAAQAQAAVSVGSLRHLASASIRVPFVVSVPGAVVVARVTVPLV
jgi:hypothetical protein